MKMKSLMALVSVVVCLLTADVAVAKERIRLVTCEWPPYAGKNLPNYGFTSEIIVKAFDAVDYSADIAFYSWKRCLRKTRHGNADAVFSAYHTDERAETFAMSDPYVYSSLYLCARAGSGITYERLEDLRGLRIGVVLGFANSPAFDNADYLTKVTAVSDMINLRKLLTHIVDLIVIDRYVAIHHLNTSPHLSRSAGRLDFLEPPLQSAPVHVMFSRAISDYQRHVNNFNKGLKIIHENGAMDAILRKYNGSEARK